MSGCYSIDFIHLIAGGQLHISVDKQFPWTHSWVPFLYEKSFFIRSFGEIQLAKPKSALWQGKEHVRKQDYAGPHRTSCDIYYFPSVFS